MNIHVIALEGFHERFGHAVGLRAADRREARHQAKLDREVDRFSRAVLAAE